jgi:4,5-DOPA dioxygenase extradiol
MSALGGDPHAAALLSFGQKHDSVRAILMVSAHWQVSRPLRVTAWDQMPLLYDFTGFPDELYHIQYPAPGDPGLAARISSTLRAEDQDTTFDTIRGLDHGAWVPARLAWPDAKIPVLQLSMPFLTPQELFQLGRALRPLRDDNILIAGTGGIVHNLSRVRPNKNAPVDSWAVEFDDWVVEQVQARALEKLFDYRRTAPHARLSVPTTEHFDPLFIVLGAAWPDDSFASIYQGFHHGNISMRSFSVG